MQCQYCFSSLLTSFFIKSEQRTHTHIVPVSSCEDKQNIVCIQNHLDDKPHFFFYCECTYSKAFSSVLLVFERKEFRWYRIHPSRDFIPGKSIKKRGINEEMHVKKAISHLSPFRKGLFSGCWGRTIKDSIFRGVAYMISELWIYIVWYVSLWTLVYEHNFYWQAILLRYYLIYYAT